MPGAYDPTLWIPGETDRRIAVLQGFPQTKEQSKAIAQRVTALASLVVAGVDYPDAMLSRQREAIRNANAFLNDLTGLELELRQAIADAVADGKISPEDAKQSGLAALGLIQIPIGIAAVIIGGIFALAYIAKAWIDKAANAPVVQAQAQSLLDKSAAEITAYNAEAKKTGKFPGTLPTTPYPGGTDPIGQAIGFGTVAAVAVGLYMLSQLVKGSKS